MPYVKRFKHTLYSPTWLREQYVERERSAADIASELDTDASAVIKRLRRYGIPTRSNSEAQKLSQRQAPRKGSSAPRPKKNHDTLHNEAWLREHYIDKDLNASEIADLLDCKPQSVFWALAKFEIETKGISAAKRGRPSGRRGYRDPSASSKQTYRRRARALCPKTPCLIPGCGTEPTDVNHIDRNYRNNDIENLERICRPCHRRQHGLEEQLALAVLVQGLGLDMLDLHKEARQMLVAGVHSTEDYDALPAIVNRLLQKIDPRQSIPS